MTPYVSDPDFTLLNCDVLDGLRSLPDESVHMCVTSPPFWGLRDYGAEGQLGLEPTPEAYVQKMVEVFREVRRVLRADGTLWLNLGDSYAARDRGDNATPRSDARYAPQMQGTHWASDLNTPTMKPAALKAAGIKPKDLCGIPWRVAFSLQADGWYLRSDIVWSKPNPMPESVTDRPTKAHEYVFLLTKSPRYFFDQEAVREPSIYPDDNRKARQKRADYVERAVDDRVATINPLNARTYPSRNLRSVWEIATQPYPEAHFATFPEELPRRCIAAGTSERGCCPECGAAWVREVERETVRDHGGTREMGKTPLPVVRAGWRNGGPETKTLGWVPTCGCVDDEAVAFKALVTSETYDDFERAIIWPAPCTVLDPFMGSGTTALVARKLGRRSIGIELSPEYAALCARRLQQQSLFAETA